MIKKANVQPVVNACSAAAAMEGVRKDPAPRSR
jgi:hypothetical protein